MFINSRARAVACALPLAAIAALLGGCGSSTVQTTASPGTPAASAGTAAGSSSSAAPSVNGIKAVPTQILASTTWQGMKITAEATTAVPFVIFDGTHEQMVKPAKNTSFHLMVMLSDAGTGVPIPYSTVWATISKAGKVVYDERQWPMIARYMGPHYGNDVSVPGAGTYQMSLLISPPVSARHVEYQNVWTTPHRATFTFAWKPLS